MARPPAGNAHLAEAKRLAWVVDDCMQRGEFVLDPGHLIALGQLNATIALAERGGDAQ
jgi:hypothetical protein